MNCFSEFRKRRFVVTFVVVNILLSVFFVYVLGNGKLDNFYHVAGSLLWGISICSTQWLGILCINKLIDARWTWMKTPYLKLCIELSAIVSYSVSAFVLVQLLNFYLWAGMAPTRSLPSIIRALPYSVFASLVISLFFYAAGFFREWKQSFMREQRLEAEMIRYQYESLRSQLNPHFLFNSLNVLSELVYDDQQQAVKFIRQLSDLFRYVLDSRDKELVPLERELRFMESYLFLLKTRFDDKLQVEVEADAKPDEWIVPMSLQLLVENAVKHNEVSAARPLQLSIRKQDGRIAVENNLQRKSVADDSTQTGLKNIRQQFALLSDSAVKVDESETKFRVTVPVLKIETV